MNPLNRFAQQSPAEAQREGMADSAFDKRVARPNSEQSVVNLPKRFANVAINPLKKGDKS